MKFLYSLFLLSSFSVVYAGVPKIKVTPVKDQIQVDGKLSPGEWDNAAEICLNHGFTGASPDVAAKRQTTKVKLQWNKDWLFIAFICRDKNIVSVGKKHDDDVYLGDACEVFLDPVGDGRQYFELQVSPDNVIMDINFVYSGNPKFDKTGRFLKFHDLWRFRAWNMPGLKTATSRIIEAGKNVGWTIEMAIPARQIMRRKGKRRLDPGELRANFVRYEWQNINGKKVLTPSLWSPTTYGNPHTTPGAMGRLLLVKARKTAK